MSQASSHASAWGLRLSVENKVRTLISEEISESKNKWKTEIGLAKINNQVSGISKNIKKFKGHKECLDFGTLSLNQGISSQDSGAAEYVS